jgi:hypothetical protein
MRRPFLMFFLAFIAVAGFSAGFRHLHECAYDRHEAFEAHIADVCTQAALRATARTPGGSGVTSTPAPSAN